MSSFGNSKRAPTPTFALVALLGTAAVGCAHTRRADDPGAAARRDQPSAEVAKPVAHHESPPAEHHGDAPLSSDARAGAPPLATSPSGLLKPDAVVALQGKLAGGGHLSKKDESGKLDEPTRQALRKFQRQNDLPATGLPDDLTVRKLGLDPRQIFRARSD